MAISGYPFVFHDGSLADFKLGPRREVELQIALDPVWNKSQLATVVVRIGAIQNFAEVTAFFQQIAHPTDAAHYLDSVVDFAPATERKECFVLDLANSGRVEIQSSKISIR